MQTPISNCFIRSALFVPGDRPDQIDKAIQTSADLVIIDLEDAVLVEKKSIARECVLKCLSSQENKRRFVIRINQVNSEDFISDFDLLIQSPPYAVMFPKFESVNELECLSDHLLKIERERRIQEKTIRIIPLIESAIGIERGERILHTSAVDRILCLAFGAADYACDLGLEMDDNNEWMLYPYSRLPVVSRAAGILAPLDAPYMTDLKDEEGLRLACLRARRMGFQGKLCIHPIQIKTCNREFSISASEIERAKQIVETFRRAQCKGSGVVQLDGRMIDKPIVERAMWILKIAGK